MNLTKQDKIKYLKEEIEWIQESMNKDTDKEALEQYKKEIEILEAILKDYEK